MDIRLESPQDYEAVERLTYEAFSNMQNPEHTLCNEHFLVRSMRSIPAFLPELSYVCEVDGHIAGHIAYTRSKVIDQHGTEHETLTFAPVSALPAYQRKGIGAALIRYTLDEARALGHRAVIILGHPGYYPKFGFLTAKTFDITLADGTSVDALMALELQDGALESISGKWVYDPVFEIDETELAKFNKEYGYGQNNVK